MQGGWRCIYTSNWLHQTEIARAILKDNGINSIAIDKRDSNYIMIGDIEVYVKEEDAILAKIILEKNIH